MVTVVECAYWHLTGALVPCRECQTCVESKDWLDSLIQFVHTPACDACGRSEHLAPDDAICSRCKAAGRGKEGDVHSR